MASSVQADDRFHIPGDDRGAPVWPWAEHVAPGRQNWPPRVALLPVLAEALGALLSPHTPAHPCAGLWLPLAEGRR